MSKKERERRWRPWWYDIFDEFERIQRRMAESFREMARELPERPSRVIRTPFGEERIFGPYVSGFSIEIGPEGLPRIRTFGNIRRRGIMPEITEEREPLVDVYEEKDKVRVIAELPGVEKEDIELRVTDNTLTIDTKKGARKYYREVTLPTRVVGKDAKANYKNGVLTVELPKIKEEKKGERISIG